MPSGADATRDDAYCLFVAITGKRLLTAKSAMLSRATVCVGRSVQAVILWAAVVALMFLVLPYLGRG